MAILVRLCFTADAERPVFCEGCRCFLNLLEKSDFTLKYPCYAEEAKLLPSGEKMVGQHCPW